MHTTCPRARKPRITAVGPRHLCPNPSLSPIKSHTRFPPSRRGHRAENLARLPIFPQIRPSPSSIREEEARGGAAGKPDAVTATEPTATPGRKDDNDINDLRRQQHRSCAKPGRSCERQRVAILNRESVGSNLTDPDAEERGRAGRTQPIDQPCP